MHVSTEKPYNGGLIDFHENVLRADLSPYLQPQPAYPSVSGSFMQAPQIISPQPMAQYIQPQPAPQFIQAQPAQFVFPPQCVAGPSLYYHINGEKYQHVGADTATAEAPPSPTSTADTIVVKERDVQSRVRKTADEVMNKLAKAQNTRSNATCRKDKKKPSVETELQRINSNMRAVTTVYR